MLLTIFQMVGASFLLVLLFMVALWCVYYIKRNASIADVGWAAGFFIAMVAYYLLGEGSWIKSSVLLLMVVIWSGRLAWGRYQHYVISPEDARYRQIRARWGERNSDFKFLILFVFQGVTIIVLSLPFLLVSCCPNPFWTVWEVLGIVIWACGVVGEYFADEQLQTFKRANPNNPSLVCSDGLWHYSRHPNYFFEWIVWVGYFFYALPATLGFLAILSPLIMYYLLRYVSGVPLVEEQLVRDKGDAYRAYQKKTSEFFPWFPR